MGERFLEDYLETLPEGPRSFPQAQLRGEVLDDTLSWLSDRGVTLDPNLREWVRRYQPLGRSMQWVPEVIQIAVWLQVVESGYPSTQACLDDVYHRQRAVYSTPFYRAIMLILSPTLLMMGAAERWKAFRKGSELLVDRWTSTKNGRVTTVTLRHPAGLYHRMSLLSLGQATIAALDACGAKDTELEFLESASTPGNARFRVSYRA